LGRWRGREELEGREGREGRVERGGRRGDSCLLLTEATLG